MCLFYTQETANRIEYKTNRTASLFSYIIHMYVITHIKHNQSAEIQNFPLIRLLLFITLQFPHSKIRVWIKIEAVTHAKLTTDVSTPIKNLNRIPFDAIKPRFSKYIQLC